jgi:choice-of-anchor C domain-containing protein
MRNAKKLTTLLAFAGLALTPSIAFATPAIINGSFEAPGAPGSFSTLSAGDTSITGWTVGGGGIDYIGNYWTASNGNSSLDLNGFNPGSISQTLTGLTVGAKYQISFDMAGNPDGNPTNKSLDVALDGITAYSATFDVSGHSNGAMGWATNTFDFTATGTSQLLAFVSTTTQDSGNGTYPFAFGPALDNVNLTQLAQSAPSPVPEPATWAMLLLGLFGIGFAATRRKPA